MDPINKKDQVESRRDFLKMTAVIPLAVSLGGFQQRGGCSGGGEQWSRDRSLVPAHLPMGTDQPERTGSAAFRPPVVAGYWKRSQTQGIVINAGGIVAFYPSKEPLQHQAQFLKGRDLYGDLTRAAHADGLMVFARMDCGSAFEPFYKAHPDWFAVNAEGSPTAPAPNGRWRRPLYDVHQRPLLRRVYSQHPARNHRP